jgi:DNA processing protein
MEKLIYIALSLLGVDNVTLTSIIISPIAHKDLENILFGSAFEIQYKYNLDLNKYISILKDKAKVEKAINRAKNIMEQSNKLNVKILTVKNKLYPKALKEIESPPSIIYIKGKNFTIRDEKSIACAGTRIPTEFGLRAADSIVEKLTKEEFTVVSGLALGIDAECHKTCLKNNGRTVAVLAHGLDMIYPKENEELAKQILQNGGTLVSEYPVGIGPDRFRFIKRNRIISGLSKGTVIFESKEKSGTMHTVDYTLGQKKKVFCPIPIKKEIQTLGLINLLNENKAIGVKSKDDYDIIIRELGFKIKNDTDKIKNIKSKSIFEMYNHIETPFETIKEIFNLEYDGKSGISINKETYQTFKRILSENNITLKEFFNAIVINTVKNYKRGE